MKNKERYMIRQATEKDVESVMKFIKDYWNKNHILCMSKQFMMWQHFYHEEFCFLIAENTDNYEIEGILGYIPYSEKEDRDVFGALWKVRNNHFPMLGLKMKLYLMNNIGARTVSAIGLNENTLELHKKSGSIVGTLKHYYILSDLERYVIAKIQNKIIIDYNHQRTQYDLMPINGINMLQKICDWEEKHRKTPQKSVDFICHRYINHPIYKYNIWGIFNKEKLVGAFITREIVYNNSPILRIVDYLGDTNAIAHVGKEIRRILFGYEYIDFYLYGIDDSILADAGFILKRDENINVIPNYFEPFKQENVKLNFYTTSLENTVLFKGDGDQDRPNYIQNDII